MDQWCPKIPLVLGAAFFLPNTNCIDTTGIWL
jgi:hypothetical protein